MTRAWQVLGIAPTEDEAAIRAAYAARLKAMDPDADVAGFARLREALALARRHARSARMATAEPEPSFEPVPEPEPESPDPAIPDPQPTEEDARARQRMQDFIGEIEQRLANPGSDEAPLVAAYRRLFDDPRMELVAFRNDFENWLADFLLRTIPASDPIIRLAAVDLDWERELTSASPRYLPLEVAVRARDLVGLDAISHPDHEWNQAWLLLNRTAETKVTRVERIRHQRAMNELLAAIRYHYPTLERGLDQRVVADWMAGPRRHLDSALFRSRGISWYGWLVIGWFVYLGSYALFGAVAG